MKQTKEVKALLEKDGFHVVQDGNVLAIRREGLINPADVRQRAATTLSEAGYQAYYLKEVYAYMGSKKPWRTDEEGYVELDLWEDFQKVARPGQPLPSSGLKITGKTKVKLKVSGE